MDIKKLETSDAQNFINFMKQVVEETDFLPPTSDEIHTDLPEQEKFIKSLNDFKNIFVAYDQGQIVGFIRLSRPKMKKMQHIAHITIGILQKNRGLGIGSQLMKKAYEWINALEITRVELTVMLEDNKAITFYKKRGFVEEGRRHQSVNNNGVYSDELYLAHLL